MQEIKKAAEGAAGLTKQLLAFSRQQVLQPQILDVNSVVQSTQKLLNRLIGEDVKLITNFAPDLGVARLDPGQVGQIIMNLAVNARDAMPTGGILTIETANVEMDLTYVRGHPVAQAGHYVMLAVSDNGIGMDASTQARIFEPFFTTKETGKGTGLGLATVYGIVKQSGGFIWVYSEPSRGTSFKIYFPRIADSPAEPGNDSAAASPAPRGTETVLVVEDVTAVRGVAREMLERSGYRVLDAANGDQALRVAAKHSGPIDLLLTDVVMPGISGRVLAKQLADLRPQMRVLYMSGYTDDAVVNHGMLEPGISYLQKPFTRDGLARKVHEVLRSPRT
jgi:CheY-like chemotaxis protein